MIILRQNNYSKGYYEQREYTSLKRKINAKIARGRVNVAEKLGEYMTNKVIDSNEKGYQVLSEGGPRDKFKDLIKDAKNKYDARVMHSSNLGVTGPYSLPDADNYKKLFQKTGDYDKLPKKLQNALGRNKNIILADDTTDNALLAHELGHLKNRTRNKKYIKRSQDTDVRQRLNQGLNTAGVFKKIQSGTYEGNDYSRGIQQLKDRGLYDNSKGFKEAFKRLRDNTAIVREEREASRQGLKLLKSKGVKGEEIKKAKDRLKKAGETYKTGRLINFLSPIQNKIQIDSRRRK